MPIWMLIILLVVWGGAIVMFILAFTTKTAQQVLSARIHRELEREETELMEKADKEDMQKPFLQRILTPILESLGNKLAKKGSGHAHGHSRVEEMLDQAGRPMGLNAVSFSGLKLFLAGTIGGIGFVTTPVLAPFINNFVKDLMPGLDVTPLMFAGVLLMAGIGYIIPVFLLGRTIKKRRRKMAKAMADTVDLMTLALEAGVGFDGAVGYAVQNTKGPLSEELERVMNEVSAGKPQADSFRDLAIRAKMPELSLLVAAIDQAMKLGVNLAASLRAQATEIRERRSAAAREAAAKLPVKMIFPLVFCIFPALFIVILGPAGIQMYEISQAGYI